MCRRLQKAIGPFRRAEKSDLSPVTVADLASQVLINATLQERFPHDPVLSEEQSSILAGPAGEELATGAIEALRRSGHLVRSADLGRLIDHGKRKGYAGIRRFWTVDPIDGTKGFLRGGQYAVAVALVEEGEVVVAAMGCPNLGPGPETVEKAEGDGTLYVAVRGQGAFMAPLEGESPERRISVCKGADIARCAYLESVEPTHSSHEYARRIARLLGMEAPPLRMDGQGKYAVLARGDSPLYLRLPTKGGHKEKVWDHAAGFLIATEAGGRVTDLEGRIPSFATDDGTLELRGVVATNGEIHERVLDAVARALG